MLVFAGTVWASVQTGTLWGGETLAGFSWPLARASARFGHFAWSAVTVSLSNRGAVRARLLELGIDWAVIGQSFSDMRRAWQDEPSTQRTTRWPAVRRGRRTAWFWSNL